MTVSMGLPDAIIFDLDDTILDDSGGRDASWRAVIERTSLVSTFDAEEILAAISREADWYWSDRSRHREGRLDLRRATRIVVERTLTGLGIVDQQLAGIIAENYRDMREQRLCPLPGAIETLDRLRRDGVRLGMATNGSAVAQRAKIEHFKLAPYFESIVIEGEFGLGKPEPEVYEALLSALSTHPAKTWSVGDNLEWDVAAPQALGIYGIWVDVAGHGLPEAAAVKPDRIVGSVRELLPTD